jgi:hypothetical protein
MVPAPISAVDAINPSLARVKQLLLSPFRWAIWWRMALVGLALSGEAGMNVLRLPDLISSTGGGGQQDFAQRGRLPDIFTGMSTAELAVFVALIASLVFALVLIHLYIMSVARFIMFDFAATGHYRLREGWKKWHSQGRKLFAFMLLLMLVLFAAIAAIAAIVFLMVRAGVFKGGSANPGLIILSVLAAVVGVLVLMVVGYLVSVLVFDLAVPMIAMERISGTQAFGRAWRMVKADLGGYAAYAGLKLVLTIAGAMVIAIINIIILIPVFIVVVIVVAAVGVSMPQLLTNPLLLAAGITVAFLGFLLLGFVFSLIGLPLLVFVQSYAVIFFAPRYLPLYTYMYGAPPAPPAPEPPPAITPDSGPPPFPPELAPTS